MTSIDSTTEIRSFHVDVPNEELATLRRRIAGDALAKSETRAELLAIEIRAAFRSLRQGRAS